MILDKQQRIEDGGKFGFEWYLAKRNMIKSSEIIPIDRIQSSIYLIHDHLYSPAALVNSGVTVVERYEYDAYGTCTIWNGDWTTELQTTAWGNPYYFTGRRLDILDSGSLKLYYYRNRYYDDYTGRFTTHDPLGITPNPQKPNVFGGKATVIHKPFFDPYFASGSEKEIAAVFRKVRDDIKAFIETMPGSLEKPV